MAPEAYGQETWAIASGAQRSAAINVMGFERGSFQVPTAITAGNFQVEVSNDGTTFSAVRADDNTVVAAVAFVASTVFNLHPNVFKARWARLFSSVAQGAARSFTVQLSGPAGAA